MTSAGPTSSSPTLGLLEWFRPGEHARVLDALRLLRDLNVRHLRTGVSWADALAPGGEAWYAWLIPTLARHVDVLPCFSYTPPSMGVIPGTNVAPWRLEDYADFVCHFNERHGDAYTWVELWNEPDNQREWNATLDPGYERFAWMVGNAADWSRRQGKKTLLGGLANADPNFVSLMHDRGVLHHFDAIGVHGFPFSFEFYWEGWPERVRRLRERLGWVGMGHVQVWVTECGYSTWRHDPLAQAETFTDALSVPAERVYWYSLSDLDPALPTVDGFHSDEREYHFGLYHADGRTKLLARLLADGGAAGVRAFLEKAGGQPAVRRPYHLVLGGCGRRGARVVRRLTDAGERVLIYDNMSGRRSCLRAAEGATRGVTFRVADVRDTRALDEAVAGASAVTHAAFIADADRPAHEFDVNVRGTFCLLEALQDVRGRLPVRWVWPDTAAPSTEASVAAAKSYRRAFLAGRARRQAYGVARGSEG